MSTPCEGAAAAPPILMETLSNAITLNTETLNRLTEHFEGALSGAASSAEGGLGASGGGVFGPGSPLGGLFGSPASAAPMLGGGEGGKGAKGGEEDNRVAQEREVVDQIEGLWGGLSETMEALNGKRLDSDKDMMLGMVGNALKGSKAMAKINKAFAIGNTIMDTARGVQKAFAEVPFPLNIGQAALVAAKGAMNIATIKGQFHAGIASVPSTGTYLLERGERVVDSRLNGDLKAFLGTMQGRPGAVAGPSIQMTVNGNPDADTLDRTRETVLEAMRQAYSERGMVSPV